MEHGEAMGLDAFERPSRDGLRLGHGAPGMAGSTANERELGPREAAFRVRALHTHVGATAQRVGIQVKNDWRRLTAFPRFPTASPSSMPSVRR